MAENVKSKVRKKDMPTGEPRHKVTHTYSSSPFPFSFLVPV